MTPINFDRDPATAAREGLQRMGPIIVEAKMNVNRIIGCSKRVSPKRIHSHLVPIPTKKMSPHTYVICVAYLLTSRFGLWEYAGNFIIFFCLRS